MPSGSVTTLVSPKLPKAMPCRAMVLAAGLGLRMRPLTQDRPKPLVEVGGKTLLDRILDRLAASGVTDVVVNLHTMAEMIECHLEGRSKPRITFSPEPELLETGGGTLAALPHLGKGPFFAVNADVIWLDGWHNALARMAEAWDDPTMDALLLVHPCVRAFGYRGQGDFFPRSIGPPRKKVGDCGRALRVHRHLVASSPVVQGRSRGGVLLERPI